MFCANGVLLFLTNIITFCNLNIRGNSTNVSNKKISDVWTPAYALYTLDCSAIKTKIYIYFLILPLSNITAHCVPWSIYVQGQGLTKVCISTPSRRTFCRVLDSIFQAVIPSNACFMCCRRLKGDGTGLGSLALTGGKKNATACCSVHCFLAQG